MTDHKKKEKSKILSRENETRLDKSEKLSKKLELQKYSLFYFATWFEKMFFFLQNLLFT